MLKHTMQTVMSAALMLILSSAVSAADAADPHAHHQHMQQQPQTSKRSTVDVEIPNIKMVREDGKSVVFADELNDGRPVVVNFIYTTCTAICPISSSLFAQLQKKLGKDSDKVHLVSVSIDPEEDTPSRLRAYAKKYKATSTWNHYTGTADASVAIQVAFNVYRGNKMSHEPATFVRGAPGKPWQRLDGFATVEELLHTYQEQVANH